MTINEAINKVVDLAKSQVGTREGENNWNPYAADPRMTEYYGWNVQNQPWCNIFVDQIFVEAFGLAVGKAMVYDGSPSCAVSAQHFKDHGAWSSTPQLGDQVFYNTGAGHTGLVVNITNEYFDAVEGNYSDKVSLVRHTKNGSEVDGFGVPNWELAVSEEDADSDTDPDVGNPDIIHPANRRACYHLEYGDGCRSKGYKPQPSIRAWQELLICWGFEKELGSDGVDGEFGSNTQKATKLWQAKCKSLGGDVEVNGVVDSDDWEEIIRVPVDL